ncbi:MAG: hypothetical protein M3N22_10065, partial [Acidobacteriota bacterium]|nr:hypothetical protein [Acidobacteriota bacterium]
MTKRAKVEAGALVLLVFSALAVWYFAGHPVAGSARASTTVIARYMPMGVENPRIHWDRLEDAQRTQYETVGRD